MTKTEGNTKAFPRCPDCGGAVALTKREGRTRELLRGIHVQVPANFEIPTCGRCGEESMDIEITEQLDPVLAQILTAQVKQYGELICTKHGITQQVLEDALGITRSYFSHLLGGRMPSATLVKLLRVFAEVPGALENALNKPPERSLTSATCEAPNFTYVFVGDFVGARYAKQKHAIGHPKNPSPSGYRPKATLFGNGPTLGVG